MADSTTNLTTIDSAQAAKEVTANGLFDAASPGTFGGRRAESSGLLVWGFYGGRWAGATVANGTLTLAASATAYVVADRATGAITASGATTNWSDPTQFARLYKIVTGASTVTSYEDHRAGPGGLAGDGADLSPDWARVRRLTLRRATTGTTALVMTTNGAGETALNQLVIASGASIAFSGTVHARQDTGANVAGWQVKGVLKNVAGTMTLLGSSVTSIGADAGASTWTLALAADNTVKGVSFTATGGSAQNVKWAARIEAVELTG